MHVPLEVMEMETPFKEGYLLFPPQGVLGQLKKSWHKKYCQLFKSSKNGIERLEIFDNEDDVGKNSSIRIITLENCVKITQDAQKHQPNVFAIVTKLGMHHFATLTEVEVAEWVSAFQATAFRDDCSQHTIEEDNELYCSSGEGVFSVRLVASEASIRCGLEPGVYTLVVSSTAIQLRSDNSLLFTWPYCYIRRYGYRGGHFTFEAGRKCATGDGVFNLEHSNQQEIFRCISSKMKSMSKLLSGEVPVVGESEIQAALGMEARSRSPLPPSPTGYMQLAEVKAKVKPVKPPRKHLFQPKLSLGSTDLPTESVVLAGRYRRLASDSVLPRLVNLPTSLSDSGLPRLVSTSLSDAGLPISPPDSGYVMSPRVTDEIGLPLNYDRVEVRREAWRTLGVSDLPHTERALSGSDTEEEGHSKPPRESQPPPRCSKILTQTKSLPSEDYDKLRYFGSSSKLNSNPGYRHIPLIAPISPSPSPPPSPEQYVTWNDYDVVKENMQAFRLADDSHRGYGTIRKKPDQEYAVVLKPKRV